MAKEKPALVSMTVLLVAADGHYHKCMIKFTFLLLLKLSSARRTCKSTHLSCSLLAQPSVGATTTAREISVFQWKIIKKFVAPATFKLGIQKLYFW